MNTVNDDFLTPCTTDDEIKDFLSIDDLIEKLKKNEEKTVNPLKFNSDEMVHVKEFLRYTNYYSFVIYRKQLTPYKNQISDEEGEQYSFTDCLSLYDFDSYLRVQLNYFTGIIEPFLKAMFVSSSCTYYTGNLKKAEFYLDETVYRSDEAYRTSMAILNKVAKENTSLTFSHHREKRIINFHFGY